MFYTVGDIKKYYNIGRHSLYRWEKLGLLKSYATPGGRKRYRKNDIERVLGFFEQEQEAAKTDVAIYARVSTKKQESYLTNQLLRLREYCREKGYQVVLEISEIANGGKKK